MKVAVFGSAFNPPTKGHLDAIDFVLNHENSYERVVLIPSFQHAFAKSMIEYDHRVALLDAFVGDIQRPQVEALAIEHMIATGEKPVYTYDVLNHLQHILFPDAELSFVIGPDNLANWNKFYKAEEITNKWDLLAVPERKAIRSTMVREALANGQSVDDWVTPSVASYLKEHNLYD